MQPRYHCCQPGRVAEARKQSKLNGIEYLEIASDDQMTLKVFFVHPLPHTGAAGEAPPPPAPQLTAANVRIEGGARVKGIRAVSATTAGNVLTVRTNARGDFSTYTLRIVRSDVSDETPEGYDSRLASIEFSFKAACPSEFDCKQEEICPPEEFQEPAINYLAKDYASFRRLMLDRMSVLMPDWKDRSPADLLVTMVEALASTADHLSYWQDAIATEAYPGTARNRISLRRHARLLDYRMHAGCNARTWIHFEYQGNAGDLLPQGTVALTRGRDTRVVLSTQEAFDEALRDDPTLFATLHDLALNPNHNAIRFYAWSDAECCLPKGATRATLLNDPALSLQPGDWLLIEEIYGPKTGAAADADPQHRQVVRLIRADAGKDLLTGKPVLEIEWDRADALQFPACLEVPQNSASNDASVSIARGNLALADHGRWIGPETVVVEERAADRPPRATLAEGDVTFANSFDAAVFAEEGQEIVLPREQRRLKTFLTAAKAMATNPADAVPAAQLTASGETWQAQPDLLASSRYSREFVVEVENGGAARLRFGDGTHGLRPAGGTHFTAKYRVGNGVAGNVGADALVRVRSSLTKITRVRNPLPAAGGVDPESLDEARQFAPQAFRIQERAVTEADWVEVAQRFPGIQRAAAQFRWTGSWHTAFVTVDRKGGLPVEEDQTFQSELLEHLGQYRIAGYDLEVNGPVSVPVDIKIKVCVAPGYFQSDVKQALLQAFSASVLPDGTRGFFHPDSFTFGQPVYRSRIYRTAMSVAGVRDLEVVRFQRYGKKPAGELASGVIPLGTLEVATCENDRNFPERGRFEIELEGGL